MPKGLFVVLEGIDGSGTTTQKRNLYNSIFRVNRDIDIVTTHEPWRSTAIKRRLKEDKDSYSGDLEMAELYVEDRRNHQEQLIIPSLNSGAIVISDRHALSTFAYQSAQGLSYEKIKELHRKEGIIRPDLTLYLDVEFETARERRIKRGASTEKFDNDEAFIRKLIENYRNLSNNTEENKRYFGHIITVDGNPDEKTVAREIFKAFLPFYYSWVEHSLLP